jgi:hypothetical protein
MSAETALNGRVTVAVTGMNAVPDNPGPGLAVARCLREYHGDGIRIVGLGYDALDPASASGRSKRARSGRSRFGSASVSPAG